MRMGYKFWGKRFGCGAFYDKIYRHSTKDKTIKRTEWIIFSKTWSIFRFDIFHSCELLFSFSFRKTWEKESWKIKHKSFNLAIENTFRFFSHINLQIIYSKSKAYIFQTLKEKKIIKYRQMIVVIKENGREIIFFHLDEFWNL